ncbi:MAG: hypothetical protein ACSHXD_14820 [Marinosulfonomonas sp.]
MRFSRPIAILSIVLSGFSAFLFVREYRIARISLETEYFFFEKLLYEPPPRAMSLLSDRNIFFACDDALGGAVAALQPAAALASIAGYCKGVAELSLKSSPTAAFAHYTVASADLIIGDMPGLNTHLVASQQNAKFENWLARRRFELALYAGSDLDESGATALGGDIYALLGSAPGKEFLAFYFATVPEIRDRILAIADETDAETQADFLTQIKFAFDRQLAGT